MKKEQKRMFYNNLSNKYFLYDDFSTPRSVGAVNGTYAESIGGIRTVTDTNSKISIINGKLDFATGALSSGDKVVYVSQTRILGKTLLFSYNTSDTKSNRCGFTIFQNAFFFINGTEIRVSINGVDTNLNMGVLSLNTTYPCAIIMRNSGVFFFVKISSYWTNIFPGSTGTGNQTLAFAPASTTAAFTIDNIRIPKFLFIPIPLQSDGFSTTTTDGMGNPENNGPVGNSWTGATWTVASGNVSNSPTQGADVIVNGGFDADTNWTKGSGWAIAAGLATATAATSDLTAIVAPLVNNSWYTTTYTVSNYVGGTIQLVLGGAGLPIHSANGTFTETSVSTGTAFVATAVGFTGSIDNVSAKVLTLSSLFRSLTSSSANIIADIAATWTSGTQAGVVINLDSSASPANFVIVYLHGAGNVRIAKIVAGALTLIASTSVTYVAGAVLRVIKDGTTYRVFYNELAVASASTISDAGIVNNTIHGLFSTDSRNTLDNFVIWARGNENQYNILDSM